ncbi:alpha/beta hydrolase fold domain-containing protein [Companilactobacillus halodurans]|uniref:Alpha/beta hydrolase n=1 Tax=Companilactobacillus halodurans TaxID=2584183 RepID=A0A5P0ZZ79_9LACO|nr:alpha/beta hydrolase fold domain-containing protein [Companilactobacillus halodurans]MQS98195.1 alpha/beta hydrolase [Companilactobacillus halodurans]
MIRDDYDTELDRLSQIKSVFMPQLKSVKMVAKDRIPAHTYEPIIYDHLKTLPDEPNLPNDLTKLRDGNVSLNESDKFPNVKVDDEIADALNRKVRYLKIYRESFLNSPKALIYLHGGAYYGGTTEDTLPFLKLLAEKFDGVIYSVDYSIAPENPYPTALEDCVTVVEFIKSRYSQLSISGDSAGASIALGVSEICHLTGLKDFYKHILFYPTVVHGSNYDGPLWNDHLITIDSNQRRALHNNYTQFKQLDKIMTGYYTDNQKVDLTAPILSPLYADPLIFKDVLVMTGEFDPFRLQDEAFIQKLGLAKCKVKYIRYGGLGHAFLNYVGQIPAVEDALNEAGKSLN